MKKKRLTIDIPLEVHIKLKSLCAEHEIAMRDLVETLLETCFESSDLLAILAKAKKINSAKSLTS